MKEKDTENVLFGKRIAKLRQEIGLSQEQLSFASGLNRTYLGEVERGEKSATVITIAKLAKGLGITKKHLFDYE